MSDTAITRFQQLIAPLAEAAQTTQHLLGGIEAPLADLYNQAEQNGDEDNLARVMQVWEQTQAIASQIPAFVAALQAGVATTEELRAQRDAFAGELQSLTSALEGLDSYDPRLAKFVEEISDELRDELYEEAYSDALEYAEDVVSDGAYDSFFDQLYDEIAVAHNTTYKHAYQIIRVLTNATLVTAEQRDLVAKILATVTVSEVSS